MFLLFFCLKKAYLCAQVMMNWQQLISNKRLGQEHKHPERHDDRTEFKRDYDRLIFSAPFRRLQNKTQVFPLPGSVFVHNRLTHSLEVASVGMSLGNDVANKLTIRHPELENTLFSEIGQIVATACLAHDMGNPPFGHSGEKAIQTYFTEGPGSDLQREVSHQFWDDITHFEGNANAFRLLTHQFEGRRQGGFVMTYSTLASIVKYPYSSSAASKKGKFGFLPVIPLSIWWRLPMISAMKSWTLKMHINLKFFHMKKQPNCYLVSSMIQHVRRSSSVSLTRD